MSDRLPAGRGAPVRAFVRSPNQLILAPLLASGLTVGFTGVGAASDGNLQRALLDAGCARAEIKPLPRRGEASIYEANCFGSSHKVIEVICVKDRCSVSAPSTDRDG